MYLSTGIPSGAGTPSETKKRDLNNLPRRWENYETDDEGAFVFKCLATGEYKVTSRSKN